MARLKMLGHRLIGAITHGIAGALAVGAAYGAGDAAYALGRVVGAG
jgi:hypothetical protein